MPSPAEANIHRDEAIYSALTAHAGMPSPAEANIHRDRSPEIDTPLVVAAIERMLGHRPIALDGRETKAPRFVWRASFSDGPAIYVKGESSTGGDDAIILEAWAIEQARGVGFPAPEVVALDTSSAIFPGTLMALSEVPGRALPPVWRPGQNDEADLDVDQMASVWRQVGVRLRALHAISVPGYGRLDDRHYLANGEVRGQEQSWADYALAPALAALSDEAFRGWLPAGVPDMASSALESAARVFDSCPQPRLLHGGICAKHTYVDANGLVTGIIDFGDRESGDPAWELTNVALWEDDTRLGWLIEGYGEPGVRDRILAYSVAHGLRLAHGRFREGRINNAESTVTWLVPRVETLAWRA